MVNWSIGIDPGFGETGVVVRSDGSITDVATWKCPPGPADMLRSFYLADEVFGWLFEVCERRKVKRLDVAIERPILARMGQYRPASINVEAYAKQMRFYQSISQLVHFLPADELWLTEVYPSVSKKLATGKGNATKSDIRGCLVAALPRNIEVGSKYDKSNKSSQEAIADAWAHSLSCWDAGGDQCERINLTRAPLGIVKRIV